MMMYKISIGRDFRKDASPRAALCGWSLSRGLLVLKWIH